VTLRRQQLTSHQAREGSRRFQSSALKPYAAEHGTHV
jgi:hypothetical protein